MGIKIDRVGTFRCEILESGVGKTKTKGMPQFLARVHCTELYDENEKQWFNVADWDMETNIFECLYGVKKGDTTASPTLGYEQIMKVFGWDGASLAALAVADYIGKQFQIRITENTYEGARSPFQVSWIDEFDADPVYTLRKLDAKDVASLDAQFSNTAPSTKTASSAKKAGPKVPGRASAHPARVPADNGPKAPTPPTPATETAEEVPDKPPTAAEKRAITKARSEKIKKQAKDAAAAKKQAATAKAAAPKAPTPPTSASPPVPEEETQDVETAEGELPLPEPEGSLTKKEAWNKIFEMRDETIDDETVKALWDAAIEEAAGEGAKHADVTGEQWSQVVQIVLADCGKF